MTPTKRKELEEKVARILGLGDTPTTLSASSLTDLNEMLGDLMSLFDHYLQEEVGRAYLSHFSYVDWHVGDDDKLRLGDYVNCNHQRGFDGYEQNFEGMIVKHHDNGLPVILYNFDTNDPDNTGDYADLQSLYMGGWEFSRTAPPQQPVKEKE